LPDGVSITAFTHWLTEIQKVCPYLIVDSSGAALQAAISISPWLIKPNKHELEALFGQPLSTIAEIHVAAEKLVKQGITHVIVSLANEGAIWITAHEAWLAKPPTCHVVNSVGAGDTMVAGAIYGMIRQFPLPSTLSFASALAALSVTQNGVGVTDMTALTEMQEKIALTPL